VTAATAGAVTIRAGVAADLAQLTDLYNHYVLNSAATFDIEAFRVEDRAGWFAQYGDVGPYRLLVAVAEERLAGYATSSRFRTKPAYDTSVEVTVYLHPERTGGGVGSLLYGALFDALRAESLHRAYAAISLPNPASVALHRKFGFTEVGTMTEVGHKFGEWWDVLWMECRI
jgi:phosphinothricin acetyltransferase